MLKQFFSAQQWFAPRHFMSIAGALYGRGRTNIPLRKQNISILKQKRMRYGRSQWNTHSPFKLYASINPFLPLNDEEPVSRPSREKNYIILEEGGLMEATVGFSIADRKTLGIKNKSRQLSLLYKVQSMNLRDT